MEDETSLWIEAIREAETLESDGSHAMAEPPPSKPATIGETAKAMLSDPYIGNAIGFNELESAPYVRGVLPWSDRVEARPWRNSDDSQLLAYLQTAYGVKSEKTVQHAFTIACERMRFNPVIDRFDALPEWDGAERAGMLAHMFLGADNTPYTRAVERLFLAGAIMRTYCPGVKFDYMPVFVGAQGIGKSTFLRKLALEDAFFTDGLAGIGSKEGSETIQGNLVVEVSELAAMKGKDKETMKAFVSRQSDDYRPAYGRRSEKHPRRCVFAGTTNAAVFLADVTGNRRYLPIICGSVDPQMSVFDGGAEAVIEQAWAEMLAGYRRRGSLPLTVPREIEAAAKEMQEDFSVDDPRIGIIGEWLDGQEDHERVCVSQIMEQALKTPREDQKKWQQSEVIEIMARHFPDWERLPNKKKMRIYGVQRVYVRKGGFGGTNSVSETLET